MLDHASSAATHVIPPCAGDHPPLSGVMLDRDFLGVLTPRLEEIFRLRGIEVLTCDAVLSGVAGNGSCGVRIEAIPECWALVSFQAQAVHHALRRTRGAFEWIRVPSQAGIQAMMPGPAVVDAWCAVREMVALGGGDPFDVRDAAPDRWLRQERRRGFKVACAGRVPTQPRHWGERAPVRMAAWCDFDAELRVFFLDGHPIGHGRPVLGGAVAMDDLERAAALVHGGRRHASGWLPGEGIDHALMAVRAWPRTTALPCAMMVDVGYDVRTDRFSLLGVRDPIGATPWPTGLHLIAPGARAGFLEAVETATLEAYAATVLRRWVSIMGAGVS